MDDGSDPDSEIFMGVSPHSGRSDRQTSGMIDPSTLASLRSCQLIISSSGPGLRVYSFVWARGGPGLFLAMITHLWPNFQPSLLSAGSVPANHSPVPVPLLIIPCPRPCPPCHHPNSFFAPVMACNAPCTVYSARLRVAAITALPGCSHSLSANQSRSKHSGKPKSKLNLPFIAPYITHQTDLKHQQPVVTAPSQARILLSARSSAIKSGLVDCKIMFYVPKIHTFSSLLGHHMCCPPCLGSCRLFWVTTH